jgi:hypothetical protein
VQAVIGASDALLALGFDLGGLSGCGLDHQGLSIDGCAVGEPDEVDASYLPEDPVRRVKHYVTGLPGRWGYHA